MYPVEGFRWKGKHCLSSFPFVRGRIRALNQPSAAEATEGRVWYEPKGGPHAVEYLVSRNSIGFQMLKKSGWKEGSGIGAAEQGILFPIQPQVKIGREGIGSSNDDTRNTSNSRPPQNRKRLKNEKEKRSKRSRKRARAALHDEIRMTARQRDNDYRREFSHG